VSSYRTNESALVMSLGRLVAEAPVRAGVFERHGINYWCEGEKFLGQALAEKGLEPTLIVRELARADSQGPARGEEDWTRTDVGALLEHIRAVHHRFLKEELPELSVIVGKVSILHGSDNPELRELHNAFEWFRSDMDMLIRKEELVLFPMCLRLEQSRVRPRFFCASIRIPIQEAAEEHKAASYALERMHALSNRFSPPPDACNTYREMLDRLSRLNLDTHLHVHEESNILFPRVIALEESLPQEPQLAAS
jgi:regulator of cell morphogenesis and NO signaling